MKIVKTGFAIAAAALLSSSAFANKITLTDSSKASKDFDTIQAALDACSGNGSYTITLEPGTYNEVLYYKGAASIKLSGKSTQKYGADVIISESNDGDLWKQKRSASAQNGRCIFEIEGTGNITLENLTMMNTYSRITGKGSNTQAEVIGFDSTGNLAAYNCAFKSHQDTLRTTGKSWFYDCYVEGDTDFIWMEARGVVALFENCVIKALYDEKPTTAAIIGAPRMNYGTRSGKGLVILNSSISSEKPQKTFLARTPWNDGYYNQVAYINSSIPDVDPKLWQGKPLTAAGVAKTVLGWKLDAKTLATVKDKDGKGVEAKDRDDILSDKEVKAEFGGRKAILNRYFDHQRNAYRKDYNTNWNVDALVKANGWKVTADKSKDLGAGEKEAKVIVYDFANDISSYADLKVEGFAKNAEAAGDEVPSIVGNAGAKISFATKGTNAVTVYGLFKGKAVIKAGNQGDAVLTFNNGSKTVEAEKEYVVYEKNGTVTITASELTYISKIVVEPDTKIKFVPVSSIAISATKDGQAIKEMPSKKKQQFTAALNPLLPTNKDFVWSVSDESVATISEFGVLTTKAASEDKTITVKATSRDSNKAAGEFQLLVRKVDPKAFTLSWIDSAEASNAPYAGNSDNEDVATVGNVILSPAKDGASWSNNTSKYNSSFSDGGLTYANFTKAVAGKDTVYVDLPVTAKQALSLDTITVSYGNHGTGNVASLVSVIRNGKVTEVAEDTSKKARSNKKTYFVEEDMAAGETVVVRVALYGYAGDETTIAVGKSPTIGTIQLAGSAK